ncbi:MAG: hypothetical protein WCL60_11265 [Methylococcales bacterium]
MNDNILGTLIQLDTHYTRSINLERDADSSDVLSAYIPTSRALQTLTQLTNTFHQESYPRSWSLIGPYGSGKSSFAAFLAHLLENKNTKNSGIAQDILERYNPALAHKINDNIQDSNAYCTVLLTGSAEPLSQRFVEALYRASARYWDQAPLPAIVDELEQATHATLTSTDIINLLKKLKRAVHKKSGKGVLIIIDELGKFLEYEARHQGSNDIYLLQQLAETAQHGGETNILLVVLMHQAFEQYSKGLGEDFKKEWLKVQGRFETIPFLETAEQTLRVMAAAFRNQLNDAQQLTIKTEVTRIVQVLDKQGGLPAGLNVEPAIAILTQCYPLHPIAALILPTLCQKVAQNERTLFSYLGSQEYYGFKDAFNRIEQVGDWVLPWEIFEYFIQNQPAATTDHLTHRRWAEVITATERLGQGSALETQLLKTIGLFNILGSQAGFKASRELLHCCFSSASDVSQLLTQLEHKSIINYRKFNSEYRIWEGSDFDLELAVKEKVQQLGRINLAETLAHRNKLAPIVARKYSIKNGLLRYFIPLYIDATTKYETFTKTEQAQIIFFFSEDQDDKAQLEQLIKSYAEPLTLYVLCENAAQIKTVVTEAIALEKVQSERAEIKSDPVAQRELKESLQTVKALEAELLHQYLDQPERHQWFWKGETLTITSRRALQNQLSMILETVYHQAPLVKNELINRARVSGQANGAKNKLIAALLSKTQLEDLGFEKTKYPAEKTIYRAVFKETGIHALINGEWQLTKPSDDNRYNYGPVWQGMADFLNQSTVPKALVDLYEHIEAAPYGVQKGVTSLLFIAYYLVNQRSLALYESGVFCPLITQELFEVLAKRPDLFSVEAIDFSGIRADLFNQYLATLIGKVSENSTLLDIVKPLAKFISQLPHYTLTTKSLDDRTLVVRDAFQNTQSPVKLLFETLPQACGFSSDLDSDWNAQTTNDFLKELVHHLNTLNKAYENLLNQFKGRLIVAFKEPAELSLAELRAVLTTKYFGLEKYTVDLQGLKAFILRLQNDQDTDKAWLESLAAFLGNAPADKWQQNNITNAEYRLIEFCNRLEQLAIVHAHQFEASADTEVTVFRVVNQQGETDQIAYLNPKLKEEAKSYVSEQLTFKNLNKQLKLAIIAELMKEVD